ncbi:rhodanese-like domain-containing protein [Agromyces sp. NPDC057679]|uniref:rhodanese-like domain-containing protein n=1 Tax=Agromyces sp. NPDC057679 TaxID=3346207 RepID=UPI003670CCD4
MTELTASVAPAAPATTALFDTVASPETAIAHFAARLAVEADVSDVAAALADGGSGFVLVDTRSDEAWAQGHVPGAVHLPRRRIAEEGTALVGPGTAVVVYCWGPGCNGATRAALEFARLGHPVKEMIGGFEYWVREGFAYETAEGFAQLAPDPLTNVGRAGLGGSPVAGAGGISCDC